jgi:hypothetical protein
MMLDDVYMLGAFHRSGGYHLIVGRGLLHAP